MNISVIETDAAAVLASYLIGAIPFGLIIGKMNGKDIRKEGSGNIGATNVTRVVGKWWGKLCFLLDFLKGLFCVLGALLLQKYFPECRSVWLQIAVSFAAVAGHIWPVWIGFKGGKGISTAAGALMGLCWPAVLAALAVWVIVFKLSRYVSLASICAAIALPAAAVCFKTPHEVLGLMILLAVLAVIKHISNIKRLLNGTENRFEKGEKNG